MSISNTPPAPNSTIKLEIAGIPIRLWWKVMEIAQANKMSSAYFIFKTLAEAVGFNQEGESYDMVLKEIKDHLDVEPD